MLKEQPDIVNSLRGVNGRSLLMKGAARGDTQIVSLLSKRDHDLSVVDEYYGGNVLVWIVVYNDGVSLEMFNSLEATQFTSDIINNQDIINDTALHRAALTNNHKSIAWLFNHGADPSITNKRGQRPGEDDYRCDDKTKRLIQSFRNQSKWNFIILFYFGSINFWMHNLLNAIFFWMLSFFFY